MKFKNFTKIFLFVAIATMFSCSSSSDGDGDGNNNGNGITSIIVTPSAQFVDFGTEVTFIVKTNQGTDVTSDSTILINGQSITGYAFNAVTTGQYAVTAQYEDLTSAAVNVTILPVTVSIGIETAQASYNLGERIDFVVLAYDNDGNTTDVTAASTVYRDGAESVTGAKVVPNQVGMISAYATFDTFTSDSVDVMVNDNGTTPGSYAQKALIEDYTGDWCGYCTRVSHAIDLVLDASDKVVVVATHVFNGDPLQNNYGVQLANAFNVSGLPSAFINRAQEWAFPEPNNVAQVTNQATGNTNNGISIVSATKDNKLQFMVNAGFAQNQSGAKLVVLLLENGILLDQTNYYPEYYGGDDPIEDFMHNHVLRHSFTNVLGDAIPGTANSTYRQYFDYNVPSNFNPQLLEIVAMIVDSNNEVLNVNKVRAGDNIAF